MQTDNQTLLDCVERITQLAVHPNIPNAERRKYDEYGYALHIRLVTLLSIKFDDGTQQVIAANAKISEVNALLKKRLSDLQSAQKTVAGISELVAIIDDLMKLAFAFI